MGLSGSCASGRDSGRCLMKLQGVAGEKEVSNFSLRVL